MLWQVLTQVPLPGGNGKEIFGDAWWLDTDNEAFHQRAGGSVAGSEAWQSRRPASVVSAGTPMSMASGLTALTEDHRFAPLAAQLSMHHRVWVQTADV